MNPSCPAPTDDARLAALLDAEDKALAMLDRMEADGLIRPGRTEREIEVDIRRLAEQAFGIDRHWHRRIVRAGVNTLATAGDRPDERTVAADDMVFLDLGPVLAEWEADVGRAYAIGDDPAKHALVAELPRQFAALKQRYDADPSISGAELYAFARDNAAAAGWRFGGSIAGHIVAEFPHARLPGPRQPHHIGPDNPDPMRDPDPLGRRRFWIGEIHLVSSDGSFGGFYERLLDRPSSIARFP
jgi:Xaa-Pro aminopeptidase